MLTLLRTPNSPPNFATFLVPLNLNKLDMRDYLFHAYGTNLRFEEGEFNFVKTRAEHGTRKAFEMRDEYFAVPEPEA